MLRIVKRTSAYTKAVDLAHHMSLEYRFSLKWRGFFAWCATRDLSAKAITFLRLCGHLGMRADGRDVGLHQQTVADVMGFECVRTVGTLIELAEREGYLTRGRMKGRPRCRHFTVSLELTSAAARAYLDAQGR